uniref:Uncharacterized protein n=1 Tax=Trichogramma kaykai TaxID=54128 RepID=A0ABD2W569_9HYME
MSSNITMADQSNSANPDNEEQIPQEATTSINVEKIEPGMKQREEATITSNMNDAPPTSVETEKPAISEKDETKVHKTEDKAEQEIPETEDKAEQSAETAQEEDIAWAAVTAKLEKYPKNTVKCVKKKARHSANMQPSWKNMGPSEPR